MHVTLVSLSTSDIHQMSFSGVKNVNIEGGTKTSYLCLLTFVNGAGSFHMIYISVQS